MRIPPSSVAWYVTGRFYEDQNGLLQDLGYFLHLSGVTGSLFSGPKGEGTARLTFRSEPFAAKTVTNGDISIGLDDVGTFNLYLNPGGATFDSPESFSQGQRIAVFRRTSVVMGETLSAPSSPIPGGLAIGMNVFSAELVESAPFKLPDGNGPVDLRDLLPNGITQWGLASENPLPTFGTFQRIVAFTGSAIAVG